MKNCEIFKNKLSEYIDNALSIILRDIEGYSYEEISEITDTKMGTIKSRLNRARSSLKSLLIKSELFKKNYV